MGDTNFNLTDFFQERKQQEEEMEKKLKEISDQLFNLIPDELATYKNESSFSETWLLALYQNTVAGSCNSDKIKEPSDYGFTDKDDAFQKLQLLKTAWQDHVEVTINDEEWYVKVEFRLII